LVKKSISAKKRARQTERRRVRNRIRKFEVKKTIKELRSAKTKESAKTIYQKAQALIDKSAQKGIIHKNKATRLKSQLAAYLIKQK
jgi:small subunit ribosomal protein S20